jgi:hypothetical protein
VRGIGIPGSPCLPSVEAIIEYSPPVENILQDFDLRENLSPGASCLKFQIS